MTAEPSPQVRRRMLELARRAMVAQVLHEPLDLADDGPDLGERRGVFVTVRRRSDRELRGCIGFVEPTEPLIRAVTRAAAAAASEDLRFEPVTAEELPLLELEISLLGPPCAVRPEEVLVGIHGVIVRRSGRGALLLPQVAREHGWDRETFLEHTCRKAGLPPEAWREPDCLVLAFTALVFGERDDDHS